MHIFNMPNILMKTNNVYIAYNCFIIYTLIVCEIYITIYGENMDVELYLTILIFAILIILIYYVKNIHKDIINLITAKNIKITDKNIMNNNSLEEHIKILNDEKYYYATLNSISNAKNEINIIMFSMYHCKKTSELINELISARKRGVMVRIILDGEIESNKQMCNIFSAERIPTKITTKYRIHNKIILIDNNITIIGSHNWTDKALFENKESSLIINNEKINNEEKKYFEHLWNLI